MARARLTPVPASPSDADVATEAEILVVDGDLATRASLRKLLSGHARVVEASTPGEALSAATRGEPAAVIVDVDLAGSGLALVSELRRLDATKTVPVLFLTSGPTDVATEHHGYALGALGYLPKPIDADLVRTKLELLLTLFRHGVELRRRERMITRQHAEILAAKAALEEVAAASRAKDLYMGVLGHDLRTPLGAILMSSRMMLMRESLSVEDRESVARIARNGERMSALIRDILDYTRGQAHGGIAVSPRATDMADICQAMIDEAQLLHPDRSMRFERGGELRGSWDRERVEQVVSNLLTNALHHGKGDIVVRAQGLPTEVHVSVHNHGAPIDPAIVPTLFEPFRRGSASTVGLGLGLYIVREILRAHRGSVAVESSEATGTIFQTRWPRETETSTSEQE